MPKIDIDLDAIVFSNATGTDTLQGAINQAISQKKPLYIAQGVYSVNSVTINNSVKICAAKGSVTLQSTGSNAFFMTIESATAGARISDIIIEGLRFDGQNEAFSGGLARPGLIRGQNIDRLTIQDCFFLNSQRAGVDLNACAGFVSRNEIVNCRTGIFANNSVGLIIEDNYLRDSKDNGIMVWRGNQAFDGSIIERNKIYTINNDTGGSGQFGNGIFVFLANSVTTTDNIILNSKYSAIRYSSSSNAIIKGNQISSARECAIFVEAPDESRPAYEGVCVQGNTIFDAGEGIKVVNSNPGSRRASVIGNAIKNVTTKTFDEWVTPTKNAGDRYTRVTNACAIIGNSDIVANDNVVENCSIAGIVLDIRGSFNSAAGTVRDQNTVMGIAHGNIVKDCPIGIGYNDFDARGFIDIADNIIGGATNASITLVNVTNLSGVPGLPTNGFGPYAREPGAPDAGGSSDPITDRVSITRNKVVPKTV